MPIDDFLNAAPAPPLGPEDLGVPALPQAPQAPVMPQPQQPHGILQMLMQAAPGILAGAMGPGAGTGMAKGLVLGHQEQQRQQQQDFENQQRTYALQEHAYQQQAAQHDAMLRQRDAVLQQNLTALRSQVKDLPDKDAYDRQVEAYANGLQGLGYRLDANWIRKAVPFAAPKAETLAVKAIERWQSLPNNKKLLTDHPEQAANAMIPFDRDGDGVPEQVRLQDLATLAGMPLAQDANGAIFSNPGTTKAVEANANGILQQLLAKSKAEGKEIMPDLVMTLQKQAIKLAKEADDKPHAEGTLPVNIQRLVDAKAKGFDSQQIVKRVQTMAEAVSFVNGLNPSTTNPADDQALIYAFAKAMDPDSVVREGEYATVQKYAQSWAERFGFDVKRVFSNTSFLTPQARQNMKTTIQQRLAPALAQYQNVRKSYGTQISRIIGKPNGEDYLIDYAGAFPTAEPDANGPPEAPATNSDDAILNARKARNAPRR